MVEQNQAANPPQATPPVRNAPAGDSAAAAPPIPAYPSQALAQALIIARLARGSVWRRFPVDVFFAASNPPTTPRSTSISTPSALAFPDTSRRSR